MPPASLQKSVRERHELDHKVNGRRRLGEHVGAPAQADCGSGSSGGPRPSLADYVRGPAAPPRWAPAAEAC